MASGIVECSFCRVFELKGISSVPLRTTPAAIVFSCSSFVTPHVKEVQLQLDDLRTIQGCESVIDKGYIEVVTSKVQAGGRWVTTRKGSRQKVQESPVAIPHDNLNAPLDTVVELVEL